MPVDWSRQLYAATQDVYSRVIAVTPVTSQPGGAQYTARGILDIEDIDVAAMDASFVSETRVVLDIRDAEFTVVPMQGDVIDIPADGGIPAEGQFEVVDGDPNGGGETTLTLRRVVQAKP
jgi:hypothetical protein